MRQFKFFFFGFLFLGIVFACDVENRGSESDSIYKSEESQTLLVEATEPTEALTQTRTPEETTADQTTQRSTDRIQSAQDRLRSGGETTTPAEPQRYRLTHAPYNHFNDSDGYTNFVGVSADELDRVLGEAPTLIRQKYAGTSTVKEVRVYRPFEKDSTGLYLYLENGKVVSFRLDTFMGIANSDILSYF